jgi:hypothetical protein
MCGPFVLFVVPKLRSKGGPKRAIAGAVALFLVARICVYAALGSVAGHLGGLGRNLETALSARGSVSIAAGAAVLLFALSSLRLVSKPSAPLRLLGIEAAFRNATRRATALPSPAAAVALGGLQGLLPCGLVYAFLVRAGAAGSASGGAAAMAMFGLSTVPANLGVLLLGARISTASASRLHRVAGISVAAVGLLLLLRGFAEYGLIRHWLFW